ncbi:MAG: hypothetical protein R3D26_05370 [Cyanobacteriota/Melainabacteria group bacterium]
MRYDGKSVRAPFKMYATAMEKTPFLSKLDMSVVEQERRVRIAKASAQ